MTLNLPQQPETSAPESPKATGEALPVESAAAAAQRRRALLDAYFDGGLDAMRCRALLDQLSRDPVLFEEMASDRAWMDVLRLPVRAPDLTPAILDRLDLDSASYSFNGHLDRWARWSRRLATAAVLAFAFCVGMWVRSSGVKQAQWVSPTGGDGPFIHSQPWRPSNRGPGIFVDPARYLGSEFASPDSNSPIQPLAPGFGVPGVEDASDDAIEDPRRLHELPVHNSTDMPPLPRTQDWVRLLAASPVESV